MIKKTLLSTACLLLLTSPIQSAESIAGKTPAIDPKTGLPIPDAESYFTTEATPVETAGSEAPLSDSQIGMIAGLGGGLIAAGGLAAGGMAKKRSDRKKEAKRLAEADDEDEVEDLDADSATERKSKPPTDASPEAAEGESDKDSSKATAKPKSPATPEAPETPDTPSPDSATRPATTPKVKPVVAPVTAPSPGAPAEPGAPSRVVVQNPLRKIETASGSATSAAPESASERPARGVFGVSKTVIGDATPTTAPAPKPVLPAAAGAETSAAPAEGEAAEGEAASGTGTPPKPTVKIPTTPLEEKEAEIKRKLAALDTSAVKKAQAALDKANDELGAIRNEKTAAGENFRVKKEALLKAQAELGELRKKINGASAEEERKRLIAEFERKATNKKNLDEQVKQAKKKEDELSKKQSDATKKRNAANDKFIKVSAPIARKREALERQQEKLSDVMNSDKAPREELDKANQRLETAKRLHTAEGSPENLEELKAAQSEYDTKAKALKKKRAEALKLVEAAAKEDGQKTGKWRGRLSKIGGRLARLNPFKKKDGNKKEEADDTSSAEDDSGTEGRFARLKAALRKRFKREKPTNGAASSGTETPTKSEEADKPQKTSFLKRAVNKVAEKLKRGAEQASKSGAAASGTGTPADEPTSGETKKANFMERAATTVKGFLKRGQVQTPEPKSSESTPRLIAGFQSTGTGDTFENAAPNPIFRKLALSR
ncbi:hypothetical protein FJ366_02730, partial [Candidatus Dependentiae bacterium]|nr:hypothetical protein [Candidatus Dependentiae bacterium]